LHVMHFVVIVLLSIDIVLSTLLYPSLLPKRIWPLGPSAMIFKGY
jgi:hypothetical protein